ncbi:MAG: hypothetical protein HYW85_01720 [Deltaproteobacteria bacterium]|nr:hypothetical protein [Deltaproteobacteria bacterium]
MNKKILILVMGLILGGIAPLKAAHDPVHGRSSATIIDNREEGANLRISVFGEPAALLYHVATKGGKKRYQGELVIWGYEGWSCFYITDINEHACINDVTLAEPWDGK